MSVFNRRLFLVLTVGSHVNGPSMGSPRTHLLLQPMQKQEPEVKRPRSKSFPAWEEPGSEGSSQSTLSYEETPKEPSVEVCSGGWGGTTIYGLYSMCRCEGNGFQAVYAGIGYINQRVWV